MVLDTPVWITEPAVHFGPPIQRHTEMHWYDLLQGSLRVYSSQLYVVTQRLQRQENVNNREGQSQPQGQLLMRISNACPYAYYLGTE